MTGKEEQCSKAQERRQEATDAQWQPVWPRQQPWRLEERSQVMRKAWVKQDTELRDRVRYWPRNEDVRH